jgi:molecular chaperone GrpE
MKPGKRGKHEDREDGPAGGSAPEAGADDGGRTSPEAAGVAPDLRLVGPEEIRAVFAKAGERDALEKERDDFRARWLRAQADLDNFRRREAQERRRAGEEEAERVLEPVLDALDTLDRAVTAAEKSGDLPALLEGLRLASRELERRLAESGVTRIEGVGEPLDPLRHRAVAQEATADHPPRTVLEVFAHGWRRGDRVIRPAQVRVASEPADGPGA